MTPNFLEIAQSMRAVASATLEADKAHEAIPIYEMAFAAAFMAGSKLPVSVTLLPTALLPSRLATKEHVIVSLQRSGIVVTASVELVISPVTELRRFGQAGDLFTRVAALLPDDGQYQCILDIGDGDDLGSYRRIAYSSARDDSLLVPDPFLYTNQNYDAVRQYCRTIAKPWQERRPEIFWRGTASGHRRRTPSPTETPSFDWLQRLELCHKAKISSHAAQIDAALTSLRQIDEDYLKRQITEADLTAPEVPPANFAEYRHQLDIDGWSNAWSLLHKLIMGSTIVKVESQAGFRQWFYGQLEPWKTYVPIAKDLSDLEEIIAWVQAHPNDCEDIAAAGAALGESIQLEPAMDQAARDVLTFLLQP